MNRLSKMRAFMQFTRQFHTTKVQRDLTLDPVAYLNKFIVERHIHPLVPLMWFLSFIGIPFGSAYLWYKEYQHHVVHRKRVPWPKHDFLNAQARPFPWGDGERSLMFHPYYNFTPRGYVTDKDGNPLPKGVYAEE